jgi:hypothetical protein
MLQASANLAKAKTFLSVVFIFPLLYFPAAVGKFPDTRTDPNGLSPSQARSDAF